MDDVAKKIIVTTLLKEQERWEWELKHASEEAQEYGRLLHLKQQKSEELESALTELREIIAEMDPEGKFRKAYKKENK